MPSEALPASPEAILRLTPAGADRLLDELEATVPTRPPFVQLPRRTGGVAVVFGDSHGDWRSTLEVVRTFDAGGPSSVLVGLGDYVDRSPPDLPCGSVANALFLLGLAARHPESVYLLQGNHETTRRIGAYPHTLPTEVEQLWPGSERYDRLLGLLERGPLAATLPCGAYLAHAGFPRGDLGATWTDALARPGDERLLELVWAECDASDARRGAVAPWGERDLDRFLAASGLLTVWRGHDPDLVGRALYGGRVMTLHTTRIYERYGGVLVALLPLDRSLARVEDAEVRHLATEGRGAPRRPGRPS
jgi:hypothetical protein